MSPVHVCTCVCVDLHVHHKVHIHSGIAYLLIKVSKFQRCSVYNVYRYVYILTEYFLASSGENKNGTAVVQCGGTSP